MPSWHAVDLRTGKRGPQLQTSTRGKVGRIIGATTDVGVSVLVRDGRTGQPVPEWRQWTQPRSAALVLVDDDDRPLWAGQVVRRVPDHTDWVPLSLVTLEGYLDRRYSGTQTFTGVDQATIAAQLVQATVSSGGVPFVIRSTLTGVTRDRTYLDSEDKTTLSLLQELMGLEQGIEFTVDVEWADPPFNTTLRWVFVVGSRIGTARAEPTRFEHPGPVTSFAIPEDFTKDTGANDVMATSSGEAGATEAGSRPQSLRWVDPEVLSGAVPRYERRFSPSTSIIDTTLLNSYARAELARKRQGLTQMTLAASIDAPGVRLNADWFLGDNLVAAITAPAFPERIGPNGNRLPGIERTVRAVGWDIDLDARTLTPRVEELA